MHPGIFRFQSGNIRELSAHLKAVGPALTVLLDAKKLEDAPLQGLSGFCVSHEGVVAGAGLANGLPCRACGGSLFKTTAIRRKHRGKKIARVSKSRKEKDALIVGG